MREREFINEIRTVRELVTLTSDKKQLIDEITSISYSSDIFYGYSGTTLVVAVKNNNEILACAVCIQYKNPAYELVPLFYVPKNMYSWVKDGGNTTTKLIKAIINISDIPVLSDIEMTDAAKSSFKKKIDNHAIKAKIFNICNGELSQYDPDIWEKDDDCRVLFLEHSFGSPTTSIPLSNFSINEGTYNWSKISNNRKKYG